MFAHTCSHSDMDAKTLLGLVESLDVPSDDAAPLTIQLETALGVGPGYGRATYRDQRHHWMRWLLEYQSPDRSARRIYNSLNCPPMVFWLAEAAGADRFLLEAATHAVLLAPSNQAAQSAAVRRVMPWSLIYQVLTEE